MSRNESIVLNAVELRVNTQRIKFVEFPINVFIVIHKNVGRLCKIPITCQFNLNGFNFKYKQQRVSQNKKKKKIVNQCQICSKNSNKQP